MNFIYALIDPETNEPRYIGNSKNPKSRYKQHLKESIKRQNTDKKKWIFELLTRNVQPKIEILAQEEDPEKAREIENYYVLKHLKTVYNIHMPGKGWKDKKDFI